MPKMEQWESNAPWSAPVPASRSFAVESSADEDGVGSNLACLGRDLVYNDFSVEEMTLIGSNQV